MKNKILKLAATLIIPAAVMTFTSCSSTPNTQTDTMRGEVVLDAMTGTATVQSINPNDRTVVLQHPGGSLTTYECGPDVRNFDQIKVGDQVTATVAESVAIVLVEGGGMPMGASSTSAMVRAPLGAMPAAKAVDTVAFTAKVVSVDTVNREVTLQTMDGQSQTVKVGPDIKLANVNPGDDVGVRVTRAFAIAVTPPTSP